MINEIRPKESSEIKTPEANKYKEIKPENGTTYSDSKQFWQDEFSENQADRTYYDDNGEKYRQGNELEPNTVFEKNGYTYKTDEIGRVVSAEGKLQVKDHKGRNEMPIHEILLHTVRWQIAMIEVILLLTDSMVVANWKTLFQWRENSIRATMQNLKIH